MTADHPFWFWLTIACVTWYSTITFLIAWRGAADIRTMLRRLRENAESGESSNEP